MIKPPFESPHLDFPANLDVSRETQAVLNGVPVTGVQVVR